jgi:hypothetical protein
VEIHATIFEQYAEKSNSAGYQVAPVRSQKFRELSSLKFLAGDMQLLGRSNCLHHKQHSSFHWTETARLQDRTTKKLQDRKHTVPGPKELKFQDRAKELQAQAGR